MTTRIVCIHGIGDHTEGFHEPWADLIRAVPGAEDAEIVGLLWDDKLDEIEERFPLVSQRFTDALKRFGLDEAREFLDGESYAMLREFLMDVLVYTSLGEMRALVLAHCGLRLKELSHGAADRTILVGHSLGSGLIVHLVEQEYWATGAIPYAGAILMAPPLGIASPVAGVLPDLLAVTPRIGALSRPDALNRIAQHWRLAGPKSLRLLVNEHDPVVADVRIKVGGVERDVLPIKQGFSRREQRALNRGLPACFVSFAAGSRSPSKVVKNHDVLRYLSHKTFAAALTDVLEAS